VSKYIRKRALDHYRLAGRVKRARRSLKDSLNVHASRGEKFRNYEIIRGMGEETEAEARIGEGCCRSAAFKFKCRHYDAPLGETAIRWRAGCARYGRHRAR